MKGTILDIMMLGIFIAVILITVILASTILSEFQTHISDAGNQSLNITYFEKGVEALALFNYGILMIFIMGIIGAVLLAYYSNVNPAFIITSIILLVVVVAIIAPIITNMYFEITDASSISTTASTFGIGELLMQNMPLFMSIGGALVIIALYMRTRGNTSA